MQTVAEFIANYADENRHQISFAWNGKHAAEFEDANQGFRWQVVEACLTSPGSASPLLLEHLFQADSEWSRQAWGTPQHFAQLGSALLSQGREPVLATFATSFIASFDTYAACHHIDLRPDLLACLILSTQEKLEITHDSTRRKPFEAALELFSKIQAGTARQGWASLKPGTEVTDISLVWPRWLYVARAKISALWKRNSA